MCRSGFVPNSELKKVAYVGIARSWQARYEREVSITNVGIQHASKVIHGGDLVLRRNFGPDGKPNRFVVAAAKRLVPKLVAVGVQTHHPKILEAEVRAGFIAVCA